MTPGGRAKRAVIWSAVEAVMRQGVQFVVLVVLARILSPEDYGVIAMLAVFVGLADIMIDSGFSAALIRRQDTTPAEESTIFYFNVMMGGVVALLLCLAAPWIATFFKQEILRHLTYAMALNVILNAFGSIHIALLTKRLNFKTIAKVSAISTTTSGILAIVLASLGLGVWSLAGQTLAASLVTVILLWAWHPWRPIPVFRLESLRLFAQFGGYLLAIGVVDALSNNLYSVLIGKFYSARDVGFYDRAQRTQLQPVNLVMSIVNRVAYPVFSSVASEKDKLRTGFRRVQQLVMFLNVPAMIGMVILAEPIVITVFGERWLPSVPILQVLGIVGLMWPMHVLNINVLMAQGRSDLFFRIMLIKKTVLIGLTVAASFQGIMAIAWAQVLASIFAFAVNAHYSRILLQYGALSQLRDLTSILLATIPAGLIMLLVSSLEFLPHSIVLFIALLGGTSAYLLTSHKLRVNAIAEMRDLLRNR